MTLPNQVPDAPANEPSQTPAVAVPPYDPQKDPFLKADRETQFQIVLEDVKAVEHWWKTADVEPYAGLFVAFLNGQIVGTGRDEAELRAKISAKHQVHPERMVVTHVLD